MQKLRLLLGSLIMLSFFTGLADAKVSMQEAKRLNQDLTPFGGIRVGNAEGTIPTWTGGLSKPPAGYTKSGQHHIDPFPTDNPLFTITSKNIDKYKKNLSQGVIALFKAYPTTFNLPIYPTRRTHTAPKSVIENTFRNATRAELTREGNGIKHAFGGVPFPILSGNKEQKALQAIWNHLVRWRGVFVTRKSSEVAVQRNGDYTLVTSQQEIFFNFFNPKGSEKKLKNILKELK